MHRSKKLQVVESLKAQFQDSQLVVIAQQNGLSVAQITDLRIKARAAGVRFHVTKNTLAKIAIKGTPFENLASHFKGPVAVAFANDPVAAAKVVVEFAKTSNEKLVVLGAGYNGDVLKAAQVNTLATLPSLDELRGKIVGILQAPASRIASILQAPGGQLARVVNAYATK